MRIILRIVVDMNLIFKMFFAVNEVEQIPERIFRRDENRRLRPGPQLLGHFGQRVQVKVGLESLEIRQNAVRAPRLKKEMGLGAIISGKLDSSKFKF